MQFGFIPGGERFLFHFETVIQEMLELKENCYFTFTDLEKAFNQVAVAS